MKPGEIWKYNTGELPWGLYVFTRNGSYEYSVKLYFGEAFLVLEITNPYITKILINNAVYWISFINSLDLKRFSCVVE